MSEIRKDPACSGTGDTERIQGHSVRDWARYEQLHDQLTDMLYPVDGGELDVEALDALLDQLDEVNPPASPLTTDTEEALKNFYRGYAPLAEDMAAGAAQASPAVPEKRRSAKPFAKAIPIAAVLIFLLGSMTAQAFGFNVFSAIARWTSEIFRLDGGAAPYAVVRLRPLEEGEEAVYDTLEEAVAAFGIDAPIIPKEIPEGFELKEVKAVSENTGILIYANYESDNNFFQIEYKEQAYHDGYIFEKQHGDAKIYSVSNIKHYLIFDLGRQKINWENGDFECKISGDISEQELKDMIDSIYRK